MRLKGLKSLQLFFIPKSEIGNPILEGKARFFTITLLVTCCILFFGSFLDMLFFPNHLEISIGATVFAVFNLGILFYYKLYGKRYWLSWLWFAIGFGFLVFVDIPNTGGVYSPDQLFLYLLVFTLGLMTEFKTNLLAFFVVVAAQLYVFIVFNINAELPSAGYILSILLLNGICLVLISGIHSMSQQMVLEEVIESRKKLTENQEKLTNSIKYARNIQEALMPSENVLRSIFPKITLVSKPKAIVSGDFYYAAEMEQMNFVCLADCTGHGIPGSFMSVLGINYLEKAIKAKNFTDTATIMEFVHHKFYSTFSKKTLEIEMIAEGMDAILFSIDKLNGNINYTSCKMKAFFINKDGVHILEYDKFPIGRIAKKNHKFSTHSLAYKTGDKLFLFTDGFADQFGGPHNRKINNTEIRNILKKYGSQRVEVISEALFQYFDSWQANQPQTDDVTILGIEL